MGMIKKSRKRIHDGMARNPGQRGPKYLRMQQGALARRGMDPAIGNPMDPWIKDMKKLAESADAPKPKHWSVRDVVKPTKGFLKRLFNRKTGGA